MATTVTHMPFTPGAGPSTNPISRAASNSSHASSNPSASDDEEEWLGPFRDELRRNQEARFSELLQQYEGEYERAAQRLDERYPGRARSTDSTYKAAKEKLDRSFEAQKRKIRYLLDEEEKVLIEKERGIRKLSLGGQVDSSEAEELIREQEELLKMYQAQARHPTSENTNDAEPTSVPSASAPRATWVPPARSMSFQRSNASQASSISQDRRGSSAAPQPTNLTDDLFPNRVQNQSRNARYAAWEPDTTFPSSSGIHEEPEGLSDSGSDNDQERDTDDAEGGEDNQSSSEDDATYPDDGLSLSGAFLLAAERSFSAVPPKTAPLNIVRGGAHQTSFRGRSRVTGRTPPSAISTMNAAPLSQRTTTQNSTRNNSDAHYTLWKPSRENLSSLNRRPSISDSARRGQERSREAEQSWTELENPRSRYTAGSTGGVPGTSASPPTYGAPSTSFGSSSEASSAAALAQSQGRRSTDIPTKFWRPPDAKPSIPVVAHDFGRANSSTNNTRNVSFTGDVSPTVYRRRNDSDTSAGSPARRPSLPQTQSSSQTTPGPKASLPVNVPGSNSSRRSPIPNPDLYASTPSPPLLTPPISASSARRSPFARGQTSASPAPVPASASGTSLSRRPTEILDPAPSAQELRAKKSSSRMSAKSRAGEGSSEIQPPPSTPSRLGVVNDRARNSPSSSALSERLAKERNRDADREHKEREEAINRQSEELRQRDAQQRKRAAELSARMSIYSGDAVAEQQHRDFEEQHGEMMHDEHVEEQHATQERTALQVREELAASQLAREAEFAEQKRVLESQRQRESALRQQKERELAAKEEELSLHKREMVERLRLREEHEIAEQMRQLELQKRKEAALEEQQRLLEAQRQLELEEHRRKEEELKRKVEELKRQQRELAEAQRKREEREREEALRRQQEEERLAEQRRKEDALRAQEDELKQKAWALHQREEALARRRKEEELRAKEEALERQRRELQQREEELARREEEEERRAREERARKEKESSLRRQQEDEDKKRLEMHMLKKLEKEREREEEERLRQAKEREDSERERREREMAKERDRRMQQEWGNEKRRQEEDQQTTSDMDRRRKEEEAGRLSAEELRHQEELLHFYEQKHHLETEARKARGTASSSSFSSSIPNPTAAFSSASAAFQPGRATSSASSIHSNWSGSQRSSASSASSGASDFSRASTASSASSAWSSSTRPKAGTASSASSGRTATGKSAPGAWKAPTPTPTPSAAGAGTGPSPSGAETGSYTNSSPVSEAEWQRRQDENARWQHEQFKRDAAKKEAQRIAQAASAAMNSVSAQDEMLSAWSAYENSWVTLGERPALFFRSFPWPALRTPSSPEDLNTKAIGTFVLSPVHLNGRSPRDRLKDQLLRWHPDRFESKWLPKIADPEERELVRHGAGQVIRSLNELMGNINKDLF